MELIMRHESYFWVIGGGMLQIPLIAEVRKAGYRVIVSDRNDTCACRKLADVFFPIDIFDVSGHLSEANAFKSQGREIGGVLAAGIDAPETMATVAEELGLPSVSRSIAHLVNNKDKFRQELRRLGHPTPRFEVVAGEHLLDLEAIVDKVGFPLIVKNTDSSGSRGTRIFHKKDIRSIRAAACDAMAVSRSGRALIEECWEGPEQTVETIFDCEGRFHPCFITDRMFDKSRGYALETGLRHPTTLPEHVQQEMYALAERVARDLGVTIGAAKYDMILTSNGPRIIEMTVRLSGGFDCQYLVPAATGKNVLRAAILTALGRPFGDDLLVDVKHKVGFSESLWPAPGRIESISGIEEAERVPGFEAVFFRNKVGDFIAPYTDCTKRACFIIATGGDERKARRAMNTIKGLIRIETS
jgi:biotin carboxylase